MSFYQRFCDEEFDENGLLTGFRVKYPANYNFGYDVVDAIARETPEKRALVWCSAEGGERTLTFGEVSELSNRAANIFLAAGLKKGDRVLVMLKKRYEYWYTVVALHKLGVVAVPVTHMLTAEDLRYRMEAGHIRAAVCVDDPGVRERIAASAAGKDVLLWTLGEAAQGFRSLTRDVEAASPELPRQDTRAEEPIFLYFTSGTTGYPKGVIHSHVYTLGHILGAKHWHNVQDGGLHFTVAETGWAKASWGKLYGQWICGSAVMVYDFDSFDPKRLTAVINRYGVTTFCAPPTIYRYLVKKGASRMPSLQYVTTAGEALNPEVIRAFREQTGLTIMEGFGQTETTLILGNLVGTTPRPGSMGKPVPLYHVELLGDDGKFCGPNEVGELVIVRPESGVQAGLLCAYNDGRPVWEDGLYHTGDMASRDEDGYYWFSGRKDDVIKTGGYRVGPFEIENVLMEHPAVMECSVVGVPDALRGQAIKAYVVPAPGVETAPELAKELMRFVNSRISEYKWVRSVELVSEMPKTISGKIRKVEQRQAQFDA